VDWAYHTAGNYNFLNKQRASPDYFNKPTEVKGWAYSVAKEIFADSSKNTMEEVEHTLNLSSANFLKAIYNTDRGKEIYNKLSTANKKLFIQYIWSTLRQLLKTRKKRMNT
jgi:hypothetical protein